ncbi:MAG: hypothetical protein NVS4B3_06650 [Gemmatimonadaceae bacterium]
MVTSTARRLDDSLVAGRLRASASALGLDVDHSWDERTFSFLAQAAVSDVHGSPAAIVRTERSSAHYFQRPDRRVSSDGLFRTVYDSTVTRLRGYGLYARLAKDNGDWIWETAQNWRSPGFEVNDVAFLPRTDYRWMLANVGRQWTQPTRWYRSLVVLSGAQQQFNYDGDRTDAEIHGGLFGQLSNYWDLNVFGIHHPTTLDDHLTRGGPVVKRTGYDVGVVNVTTDSRRTTVLGLRALAARALDAPAYRVSVSPSVAIKPASNIFVSVSPTFDSDDTAQQYVTAIDDPGETAFYGQRYVFAFLRQRSVSVDTRLNITLTPNFTLELFAQPFISSGDYAGFRQFAATRSVTMLEYGRDVGSIVYTPATSTADAFYTVQPGGTTPARSFTFADPNFSFRSLRGNAVIRWEYRPGSTVFFVWTQERSGNDTLGTFDFARERAALFRDRPTNIFQVKMNFWIGR